MKKKKKLYRVIFTTRKSFSFVFILIFLIFICLSLFIIFINEKRFFESIVSLLILFILCSFLLNNKIVLEKYFIRIYFGIFILNIKYKDIKGLYISNNHILSLSSSFHKVGIKTNKLKTNLFDIFISPMDQENFIDEVKNRC